ncbi:MAG: arylsulfatase [Gemmatimonadota bacterium]|nr:arylsulfatase [Gemmatimonadota bacterium]
MNSDKQQKTLGRREFFRVATATPIALAAAGAAAGPSRGLEASQPATAKKPNILYLMADQHRYDCMGNSGNPVIKTPNLDRIAAGGVRFTRAYTSTPSCTPARSAILTGLSPWHHGMLGYGRVAERFPFELPRAVRNAGYHTFGIGKMHWFPQTTLHGFHGTLVDESSREESPGFLSDYRRWFRLVAPGLDSDASGIGWNDHRATSYPLPEELHPTCWTGDRAVEYIENYDREEPFMLKVSFARPHSPYDPPARFFQMYSDSDMPDPAVGKWAAGYEPWAQGYGNNLWHGKLPLEKVRMARRGYYGSVSFIDEQIGRILAALEAKGELDNTLIVYFADHGDMLGDHNLWRKTYAVDGSARVPMLLRWPRSMGMEEARGTVRNNPVELRDILPTFLDAAGAQIPEGLDGRSMLELVRGEEGRWREVLDLEHWRCYSDRNNWNALTDGRYKYIFHAYDGSEQLFDMHNDPDELEDLAILPKYRGLVDEWRGRMGEHLAERGEPYVKGGRPVARHGKDSLYGPNYPGSVPR